MSDVSEESKITRKAGGLLQEFQQFALKGNVVDLAVAVVVGNAFTRIVNSLVSDVITPITQLLGSPNVQNFSITLRGAQVMTNGSTTPPVLISYGDFLQSIISFIISAAAIFALIKLLTVARDRFFRREEAAALAGEPPPAPPSPEVAVLQEIRDTLKEMKDAGARR